MDNRELRKSRLNTSMNTMGKIPPQAVDLENIVLGAIMLEKNALIDIADFLRPEAFYIDANKKIYTAIQNLSIQSKPIDIMTVTAELRSKGELEMVGGAFYVTDLTSRVASSANIEYHARLIQQAFIKREIIRTSAELIEGAYSDEHDVFDLLSKSEFEKDNLLQSITVRKEVTNSDLFKSTLEVMSKVKESSDLTGVPSGFNDLDKITGGWQKSDLIILAARPGMGKTSFALQNALNASFDFNIPGAVFSLEMSMQQLMRKELAIMCDIALEKFRKNTLADYDWEAIGRMTVKISNAPIHWDDTPSLSLIEFCAKARRLKKKYDIQYIVIDYLQLMVSKGNKGGNREQEIGQISRGLKGIAKELDIPVIALSQLSRQVESRPNKTPMLSDLRESGSIEQDADMVIFIYRPEYYGITEDVDGESTDGLAEIIIAKHRNGETDEIPLKFNKKTTGFDDIILDFKPANTVYHEPKETFKETTLRPSKDFDTDDEPPF